MLILLLQRDTKKLSYRKQIITLHKIVFRVPKIARQLCTKNVDGNFMTLISRLGVTEGRWTRHH